MTKRNANANVATVLHRDRKATPYVLRMLSSNLLDATSGGADSVDYAVRRKNPFFVWVYLYAKRGSFSKTGSGRTDKQTEGWVETKEAFCFVFRFCR